MKGRITDLRDKEIIDVSDGGRYGYVGDVEVDLDSGKVLTLVVPGRLRLLGLLGREPERVFAWEQVKRIGADIVLVEGLPRPPEERQRRRRPPHTRAREERSDFQS